MKRLCHWRRRFVRMRCAHAYAARLIRGARLQVSTADLHSASFMKAQLDQISEMVSSSYSHPSVLLHGFYNEGPSYDPAACAGYNASASAIRALVPPSHRMVTWASSAKTKDACLHFADVLAFNEYPGWCAGFPHARAGGVPPFTAARAPMLTPAPMHTSCRVLTLGLPVPAPTPAPHPPCEGRYTESFSEINQTWAGLASWAASHFPTKPFLISETGGGGLYEWHNGTAPKFENYTIARGALEGGGDVSRHNATWKEAVAYCNATATCRGFTFRSAEERPTTPVGMYFKDHTTANSDSHWVSWVRGEAAVHTDETVPPPVARTSTPAHLPSETPSDETPSDLSPTSACPGESHAPKWSQQYQAEVVAADVSSALSLAHVSGISIWQFSDIKADDHMTKVCGSCHYATPWTDGVAPINCTYIDASCFRPGGENHKGIVDLWRRPKLAFGSVRKLFRARVF